MDASEERRNSLAIARNRVQCLKCLRIIWSESRHDYRTCGCPQQTMVDGGLDYVRCGGVDLSMVNILTEYKEYEK